MLNVKELRLSFGLSQAALSEKTGISLKMIAALSGFREMQKNNAAFLSMVLEKEFEIQAQKLQDW